ncbi:MAG: chemotaxis protein CheV [Candidatus Riflebacteria bacterium]|nr:chemotaxis protein CheV [Candidatus Riflebacteria bacterium]
MAKTEILLESGTNELEVAEFYMGKQSYGINVAKIREIVLYMASNVTFLIGEPPGVLGTIIFRGHAVPLIDLHKILNLPPASEGTRQVILISEFNQSINAFLVDGVSRIHRISWADFTPMHPILTHHSSFITGSFHIEKREILILDFECIINDIFPGSAMSDAPSAISKGDGSDRRANANLLIVEDSKVIQTKIINKLTASGFKHVNVAANGEEALKIVHSFQQKGAAQNKKLIDVLDVIVSDIEMPIMDGLTFCRNIKSNAETSGVPIIMFSSMINDEMARKCTQVGADHCLAKPELDDLIGLIDQEMGKGSASVAK